MRIEIYAPVGFENVTLPYFDTLSLYKKNRLLSVYIIYISFFFLPLNMSILSNFLSIIIILPIVPVLAYVIGLLVPASHIVSRSSSFNTSSKRLWHILTDVSKYPEWQSKVEDVMIEEISKEDNNNKVVFIELSKRKRHSVIVHHERIPYQRLIRILEERPSVAISGNKKIPTFSGSWTFDIIEEKETDDQVTLKITEQGVIKKPLVRITHLLLFGFHSRIDRFMKDLHQLVDNQKESKATRPISDNEEDISKQTHSVVLPHQKNNSNDIVAEADTSNNVNQQEQEILVANSDQQIIETNDSLMTESNLINGEKEWDLMSEIYERPKTES
jgi:hypothetical protein